MPEEDNSNNNRNSENSNNNSNSDNSGRQIPRTNPSQRSTIEKGGENGREILKK
ncbi:hypothetical protein GO491_11335 [Flavobacteriaceae bacterium Ap0902]|nr:hypothetical protein [Flavobacteriaceae bacterium Ap0902]